MNEVMWVVLSEWNGINTEVKAFCEWWAVYDELRDINGLWLCERGKRVSEIRWVWAKDDEWWAWGKLNHEQSSKQTKSFREGSCPPVGWGIYVFIMEF